MKLSAVATLLCLAPAADAFVVAPPSARVVAMGRSTARQSTGLTMVSPAAVPAAVSTLLQSSAPLILAASSVAEPGSVDAPAWVLPAGAVTVILAAGLIPLLLKVRTTAVCFVCVASCRPAFA